MSRNEKTTSVIDYMERQKKLRLITFVVCAVVVASVLLATMVMGLYSQYSKPTSVADFEITTTNGEVEIREYTGDALFVNIPPQINGCPVTAIGDEAFYGNERVRRITMPDSVTEIGSSAFGLCTSLRSVELSENITAIGDYAFTRCLALSEVSLPEGITQIGEYTFTHSGIRRIDLPQKVTAVGKGAFMNCHELQDVTLPDSIT
ncbi:MAG: leucine-rich repeat domain-containing protein, partial [Clostridia bacterium]|nr:leucine-rich repeat domain-containing protein [Clostridia bacterium]